MAGWGPPLRIARRTARRSIGRTLLVAALIGVPVFAASWIGLMDKAQTPTGETLARTTIGSADAQLTVSTYAKLNPWPARPSLMTGDPGMLEGTDQQPRDTSKVDPLPFLPAGSTTARALTEVGTVDVRGPGADTSVGLVTGDGRSKLTAGTFRLDGGQLPGKPTEVAVSPSLAEYLGLLDGDKLKADATLTAASGQKYQVVGLARTFTNPSLRTIFGTPDTPLATLDPNSPIVYLADLPDGTDADALSDRLLGNGLALLPRANIVDPPPDPYGGSTDAGAVAVMALVIGFGILEIVLLAGTAFAVIARRQTRDLGLVTAAGGTPRDIRRIVLAQGLFMGAIGAGGGLLLAILATLAGRPLWEKMLSTLIVSNEIPWLSLVPIAALGLLAGLAAAIVPAISAGRQTPLAALSGRFAAAGGVVRLRRPAIGLVIFGVVSTIIGSIWMSRALVEAQRQVAAQGEHYRATVTPTEQIALVLLGITATIVGLVWMLPNLVAKLAGFARFLPLSGRLALRDAARHRHRTGPAAAAIMMSVGATAAIAFAISNSIAADAEDYVPESLHGDAVLRFSPGGVTYSPVTAKRVADALPTEKTYEIGQIVQTGAKRNGPFTPTLAVVTPPTATQSGYTLMAVDPAYIARFPGYGPQAAEALRTGKIVLPSPAGIKDGKVPVSSDGDPESKSAITVPATAVASAPTAGQLSTSALISTEAAKKLGTVDPYLAVYQLEREPTGDELNAVAKLLGHDDYLHVEKGYESPARLWFLGLMAAATIVTLLGVAISVSLSAAEGRADLATLAAIGAQPRRRRNLAAAQAWVLGELGCLLGVGVGALYGYTAHAAFGSPHFMIPWREIGGIVIVVPLFAGLLAWLLTRSRLPMVSRVD
ncbi:ABC transporter permease [Kribbella ginsengisoli]|uniref:ABC3 transporter permease C-terminal domain-containing protein n=1 Tax=Kribbella ginsengisoli TaxID=363865 RepID=A0ABP6Y4B7_9ACTN